MVYISKLLKTNDTIFVQYVILIASAAELEVMNKLNCVIFFKQYNLTYLQF